MLFYTLGQSQIFIAMLYAGLGAGLWYDVLGIARRLFVAGRILTVFLDVLFGLGAVAIVLVALLRANYGELRLYALMGALCGFVLYAGGLRPLLAHCARFAISRLAKVYRRVAHAKIIRRIFR